MAALIETLIDKQDSNEIIRDQIAAILAIEVANQRVLATAAGKDPDDFSFDIFREQMRPFEASSDNNGAESGELKNGLVNISFDNDTFDNRGSDAVGNQKVLGTFYLDCYAHRNQSDALSGDEATNKEADRIARLVRNIMMSGVYTYLKLGGPSHNDTGVQIVFKRYVTRREKFVPSDREGKYAEVVAASRITLVVDYIEFSPQAQGVDLDLLIWDCEIGEDGLVTFDAQFDYTT
jgi:hypothetical protein